MGKFVIPKLFADNEPIVASVDLNALMSAAEASLNAIEDEQVSPSAAIVGSKFVDDSIAGSKFNGNSVSGTALATGAVVRQTGETYWSSGTFSLTESWQTIVSKQLTIVGGTMLVYACVLGHSVQSLVGPVSAEIQLLRDTTQIAPSESASWDFIYQESQSVILSTPVPWCLPVVAVDAGLAAGTYTWSVRIRKTGTSPIPENSALWSEFYQINLIEMA